MQCMVGSRASDGVAVWRSSQPGPHVQEIAAHPRAMQRQRELVREWLSHGVTVQGTLEGVFGHIDANGDGLISAFELGRRVESEELYDAIMAMGDQNGDGKISLNEFKQLGNVLQEVEQLKRQLVSEEKRRRRREEIRAARIRREEKRREEIRAEEESAADTDGASDSGAPANAVLVVENAGVKKLNGYYCRESTETFSKIGCAATGDLNQEYGNKISWNKIYKRTSSNKRYDCWQFTYFAGIGGIGCYYYAPGSLARGPPEHGWKVEGGREPAPTLRWL
eukprot:SAG31_NODE_2955_length_4860_cov_3.219072_6_plen_280_part_00